MNRHTTVCGSIWDLKATPRKPASQTTGPFYTLTVTNWPSDWGTISLWPVASSYPTNRQVTLAATPNSAFYYFQQWAGGIGGSNNPIAFFVRSNMAVEALYAASCSNSFGVPNWWLAQYGLAVNDVGANADRDGDGLLNWQEYYAGTDPTNPLSCLRMDALTRLADRRAWWSDGRA